jgi:hypothetical protein
LCQKPCFGVKKFGKVWKKVWKQGFSSFWNLQKFQNLFYSELSEKYEKTTLNLNLENWEKLVRTQKLTQKFGLKFGMKGLNTKMEKFGHFIHFSTWTRLGNHSLEQKWANYAPPRSFVWPVEKIFQHN